MLSHTNTDISYHMSVPVVDIDVSLWSDALIMLLARHHKEVPTSSCTPLNDPHAVMGVLRVAVHSILH